MAFFNQDYLDFFSELEQNNNKDWFDINRKRYEKTVKIPFKGFIQEMALALQSVYPDVELRDNYSVMRINRDIRFSKDKTPYKIHMGGMVSPYGKKEKGKPGFYVQANHADVRVYSGVHSLEKEQLYAIREHITDNLNRFNKLINNKDFKSAYNGVLGEKNKRIPKEFSEAAEKQPLIFNKSFYWYFKLPAKTIIADDLVEQLVSNYKKAMPLNRFFEEVLRDG